MERKSEDNKMEPIDADASPGQNPGALNHNIEGWGPGWVLRRDPPQLLKGSRTFGVAAGGCPAPFRRNGVRRLRGAASRRGAGLTADLPQLRRGKGR
jgi:hypothetical protein